MEVGKNETLINPTAHSIFPQVKKKESLSGIGMVYVRQFKMVDGEKVYLDEPPFRCNLIVKKGRGTLIDLMLGLTAAKLKYLRWGQGGAPAYPDGDPLEPYTVLDDDEDVAHFIIDKPLNTPTRLSSTEVQFVETLICDEVNTDINEAAMMFENPADGQRSIFARITFPTVRLKVEKGTGIELKWVFNFNKAEERPL